VLQARHVNFCFIPFILEDSGLLPKFIRHSHIDNYAPAVSRTWRLPESAMILGYIPFILEDSGLLPKFIRHSHIDNYAPAVSLTWRLPESAMILGYIPFILEDSGLLPSLASFFCGIGDPLDSAPSFRCWLH
jgi:hypothetical protein